MSRYNFIICHKAAVILKCPSHVKIYIARNWQSIETGVQDVTYFYPFEWVLLKICWHFQVQFVVTETEIPPLMRGNMSEASLSSASETAPVQNRVQGKITQIYYQYQPAGTMCCIIDRVNLNTFQLSSYNSQGEFHITLLYGKPKILSSFYVYLGVSIPFPLYATLSYLSILKYPPIPTVSLLAIVQKTVAISKCSSMPEWHTVEMASTVHGDHISGIKHQAYPKTTLPQKSMFGI